MTYWGFYSAKQHRDQLRQRGWSMVYGYKPSNVLSACVYADEEGTEHRVSSVSASREDAEEVRSRFPDAGPLVGPLVRFVR